MTLSPQQADWLYRLQQPWPLVSRPLQVMAEALRTTEADLLAFIARLRAEGIVRRIGGVFDARRLGYRSCLFAIRAAGEEREAAAAALCAHPGVTHAYLRGWPDGVEINGTTAADYVSYPQLWYTLSARADRFEAAEAPLARFNPIPFPALTRYKIDVLFDTRTRPRDERTEYRAPAWVEPAELPTEAEQTCIRRYQDDTCRPEAPFRNEDLPHMAALAADGRMRRFSLLLHHHAGGFTANGMCCWPVAPDACDPFGRRLAAEADVTHCYARPARDDFPFTLYAMIHKRSWQAGVETFNRLTSLAGLPATGKLFFSTREYKKSSMRFFTEQGE